MVRLLLSILLMLWVNIISVIVVRFGLHILITVKLKLVGTPIMTSRQPVRGTMTGTAEQAGLGMT